MPTNDHRFGISTLSKSNMSVAYEEEILTDKKTGEMLVKTTDGDIVTYGYNARVKTHIVEVAQTCINYDVYGPMYSILLDNKKYPLTLTLGQNILADDVLIIPGQFSTIYISLDVDCVEKATGVISDVRIEPSITITYALMTDDGLLTSNTYTGSLLDFNKHMILLSELTGYSAMTGLRITNISVSKNDRTDNNTRIILHNIIAVVEA